MGRLIYLLLIGLVALTGCAGVNSGNQQTGGDMSNNRPNVLYEGTGIADPNSEL